MPDTDEPVSLMVAAGLDCGRRYILLFEWRLFLFSCVIFISVDGWAVVVVFESPCSFIRDGDSEGVGELWLMVLSNTDEIDTDEIRMTLRKKRSDIANILD